MAFGQKAPSKPAPAKPAPAKPAGTQAKPATPAAKPAAGGNTELAQAQLDYFKSGAAFYKAALEGKVHLAVVGGGASASAAAGTPKAAPAGAAPKPAAAKPAGAPKPPTSAAKPGAVKPGPAKPATSSSGSAAATSSGGATGGDARPKTRKELLDMCTALGIGPDQTGGKKAEELRALIEAAEGGETTGSGEEGGEETAEGGDDVTQQKAEFIMQTIEEHYDTFGPYIDPDTAEDARPEGFLGCGGDCARCHNPEGYEDAAAQVAACYTNVCQTVGIEPTL